jgi:hypothetical protein
MSKLRAKYGKLTVLSKADNVDGHEMTHVRCGCGQTKTVRAENLRNGQARSCGAPACRAPRARKAVRVAGFKPRLPRALTLAQLKRAHGEWQSPQRRSMVDIAATAGVSYSTLRDALRSVSKSGGWDNYVRLLGDQS